MGERSNAGNLGRWRAWDAPEPEATQAYVDLIEALRGFQARLSESRPPAEVSKEITDLIGRATEPLVGGQVGELRQIWGHTTDVPGRAQALVPPLVHTLSEPDRVAGTVVFSPFYRGGGGAAHGGALPLIFDEILGRLAGSFDRPPTRTAYLHVNFRKITPLDRELQFEGAIDRIEGRKHFLSGRLLDGEDLLADAEGLFLTLKPGQP